MVKYDEYGRKVEEPAKPKKPEWYEADSPFTFAISIVNRRTGEGVKDWGFSYKLKTPKRAVAKAWEEMSGMAFQPATPVGQWFMEQDWSDLYLVARPITANRDREQYKETGIQVFSLPGFFFNEGNAWDYVTSPPSEPQRFMEREVGPRSPHTFGYYESTGYHGESTIIPLSDVAGE